MDDYLNKPVDLERLARVLDNWLVPKEEIPSQPTNESAEMAMSPSAPSVLGPVPMQSADSMVDWTVIENIIKIKSDGSLAAELLGLYYQTTPEYLQRMENAIQASYAEGLYEQAHGLKGSSLNLGLTAIGNLAKELEEQAKSGTVTAEMSAQFEKIKEFYLQTKAELDKFFGRKAA